MSRHRSLGRAAIVVLFAALPSQAKALTGGDVLAKMTSTEQLVFLSGAIQMTSWMHQRTGDPKKSDCITAWFNTDPVAFDEMLLAFDANRHGSAAATIELVLARHCGA